MNFMNKMLGIGKDLTEYTVISSKIPKSFDGFKILHLSDFHSEPEKGMLEGLGSPDIIAFSGDMTDDRMPTDCFITLLEVLLKKAPVYLVSGNHDMNHVEYDKLVSTSVSMGAVFLEDKTTVIEKNGEYITLHGIKDSGMHTAELIKAKTEESLLKLNRDDGFEMLLYHRANEIDLVCDKGFDLILSGHMHGGQIQVPGIGGLLPPKSSFAGNSRLFFPKYCEGTLKKNDTTVIINRGFGNSIPLPRLFNPTEAIMITLKKEN